MSELAWLLGQLSGARVTAAASIAAAPQPVGRVTADSRQVEPGTLFVAVAGEQVDGHCFIPQAVAAGAVAVVGSRTPAELAAQQIELPPTMSYVQVADSRRALALLSAALHGFPSGQLAVVGITGTDGKTTTCMLLEAILAQACQGAVGLISTVGARIQGRESDTGLHVTTPDAPAVQAYLAEMRRAGCRYAVLESTSHGLAQDRVGAVAFDVAAVTNITHEHLDYHGSQAAYVAAKARLFQALYHTRPKQGIPRCAVLNRDDPGSYLPLRQLLAQESHRASLSVPVRTYGLGSAPADVVATDIVYAAQQSRFTLHWWEGSFGLETRLIGPFNVYNIACAATVALSLGVTPRAIQAGVRGLTGVVGRMERIDRGQPFLALVDFAHSPASLERALTTLATLLRLPGEGSEPQGRLIAVFGCAGLRDRAKRRLMGQISGRLADYTVITAEDPRTEDLAAINREIAAGVADATQPVPLAQVAQIVPDRAEAIQVAVEMAQAGDVVAVFGKGHERSICFGETEYPWSDQQALGWALTRRLGDAAQADPPPRLPTTQA